MDSWDPSNSIINNVRWRAADKKVGISAKKVQKKCKKKVSKKGPKKGPKKGQYYSLKQKSEGHFSVPKKKEGTLGPAHIYWGFENVTGACTLAENRENLDKQTDKICSGRGQADVISASRKNGTSFYREWTVHQEQVARAHLQARS